MSGGCSSGFRPSANVQSAGLDGLRQIWLGEAALAPDAYRASWGLSALTPQTRQAALQQYGDEQPYVREDQDYFSRGRPARLPLPDDPLSPLGQFSAPPLGFMAQNDAAMLARDVGGALLGRPMPSNGAQDALSALFGPQPRILGGY